MKPSAQSLILKPKILFFIPKRNINICSLQKLYKLTILRILPGQVKNKWNKKKFFHYPLAAQQSWSNVIFFPSTQRRRPNKWYHAVYHKQWKRKRQSTKKRRRKNSRRRKQKKLKKVLAKMKQNRKWKSDCLQFGEIKKTTLYWETKKLKLYIIIDIKRIWIYVYQWLIVIIIKNDRNRAEPAQRWARDAPITHWHRIKVNYV